jgi:DNA-binding transcriptional regulator YiaG
MPKKILPRIVAVAADKKLLTLLVHWNNGDVSQVDVAGLIKKFRVYQPLRHSPELFMRVQVGEYGTDVFWTDEIDMAADTLWRLAQEQSGFTMSPDAFKSWRERKAYTLDTAATALGISRRMVAYYEQGTKPIPRVVALATHALDLAP